MNASIKHSEKGFTLVGVVVSIAILALVMLGTSMTVTGAIKFGPGVDSTLTIKNQIQHAQYWISRDIQMARTVVTEDLPANDFLLINWIEFTGTGEEIDHTVTYFFEELDGEIGTLKRSLTSSAGENQVTTIAHFIRYAPADPDNSSQVTSQDGMLAVRLIASFGDESETCTFNIYPCKIPVE